MHIYLVGGAVRDTLLGYSFHERDWVVVGAHPQALLDLGYQQVGKDFPVFLHPETKEEYALARTERKAGFGYQGFEFYTAEDVTLEEDLSRRDLTINAMALDGDTVIDPYGGKQDLHNKVLRHVSPAFAEDPLRVLRTARFYARYAHLGFTIAEETYALMQKISDSGELQHLSKERVWKETERALGESSPSQYFIALKKCHALGELFAGFEQLSDEVFYAMDGINSEDTQQSKQLRFACLFYGIDTAVSQQLLANVKTPNEFKELAVFVSAYAKPLAEFEHSQTLPLAEELLTILEHCDPFRKPERFALLLTAFKCCGVKNLTALMAKVVEQCTAIKPAEFAKQGLKGQAIGEAVKQARLEIIRTLV